ncbi:unnamed protein product [Moneuplotes crassus]|uniref:RING-type domain-containing protein n=1 Tax=Euplotes crassus TaxID=5936 RepID=A0AAD1U1Y5_EUPCR|nr:unnamed protein product [Moneuplotes crassus]
MEKNDLEQFTHLKRDIRTLVDTKLDNVLMKNESQHEIDISHSKRSSIFNQDFNKFQSQRDSEQPQRSQVKEIKSGLQRHVKYESFCKMTPTSSGRFDNNYTSENLMDGNISNLAHNSKIQPLIPSLKGTLKKTIQKKTHYHEEDKEVRTKARKFACNNTPDKAINNYIITKDDDGKNFNTFDADKNFLNSNQPIINQHTKNPSESGMNTLTTKSPACAMTVNINDTEENDYKKRNYDSTQIYYDQKWYVDKIFENLYQNISQGQYDSSNDFRIKTIVPILMLIKSFGTLSSTGFLERDQETIRKIYRILLFARPQSYEEVVNYLFPDKDSNGKSTVWKHKMIRKSDILSGLATSPPKNEVEANLIHDFLCTICKNQSLECKHNMVSTKKLKWGWFDILNGMNIERIKLTRDDYQVMSKYHMIKSNYHFIELSRDTSSVSYNDNQNEEERFILSKTKIDLESKKKHSKKSLRKIVPYVPSPKKESSREGSPENNKDSSVKSSGSQESVAIKEDKNIFSFASYASMGSGKRSSRKCISPKKSVELSSKKLLKVHSSFKPQNSQQEPADSSDEACLICGEFLEAHHEDYNTDISDIMVKFQQASKKIDQNKFLEEIRSEDQSELDLKRDMRSSQMNSINHSTENFKSNRVKEQHSFIKDIGKAFNLTNLRKHPNSPKIQNKLPDLRESKSHMVDFNVPKKRNSQIRPNSNFSLKQARMLLKYARKDGISRNDLLQESKSGENTVSVLYCYNLLEKVSNSEECKDEEKSFKPIGPQGLSKFAPKELESSDTEKEIHQEDTCELCSEKSKEIVTLPCGHKLCKQCFISMVEGRLDSLNVMQTVRSIAKNTPQKKENWINLACPFYVIENPRWLKSELISINQPGNIQLNKDEIVKNDKKFDLNFDICIQPDLIEERFICDNVERAQRIRYFRLKAHIRSHLLVFKEMCVENMGIYSECSNCHPLFQDSQEGSTQARSKTKNRYCYNCLHLRDFSDAFEQHLEDYYEFQIYPQICPNCYKICAYSQNYTIDCPECQKSYCFKCGLPWTDGHYNPFSNNSGFCQKIRRSRKRIQTTDLDEIKFSKLTKVASVLSSLVLIPLFCVTLFPFIMAASKIMNRTPYYREQRRNPVVKCLKKSSLFLLYYLLILIMFPMTSVYIFVCLIEFLCS